MKRCLEVRSCWLPVQAQLHELYWEPADAPYGRQFPIPSIIDVSVTAAQYKYRRENRGRHAHKPQQNVAYRALLLLMQAFFPVIHFALLDIYASKANASHTPRVQYRTVSSRTIP